MSVWRSITVCVLCLGLGILPGSVRAQVTDPVFVEAPKALQDIRTVQREPESLIFKTVDDRLHPDFQAVPMRWSGLTLYPLISISEKYDDNIFATESGTEQDFITRIRPRLAANKKIGRHQLSGVIEGDVIRYADNDSEDVENFNGRFGGFLEMRHDIKFPFEMNYALGHEKREQNFSATFATEPIEFQSFGGALGVSYNPNRLGLSLIGRYSETTFDDGVSAAGLSVIRSDSDRNLFELEGRAAYQFMVNHSAFLSTRLAYEDYERRDFQNGSFSGVSRDSASLSFLAGFETEYKGLLESHIGIGYGTREFDDNGIDDTSTLKASGNVQWNITKLATLNLGLRREIAQDNEILQGIVLTQLREGLDYELSRDLILRTHATQILADFEETGREDEIYAAGLGLKYYINPRFAVEGRYDYKMRDSTVAALDYDRNTFLFLLTTRF